MSLRVGMFSSALPQPGRKPGGADVVVHNLSNRLVERGHRVTVFTYSTPPAGFAYDTVQLGPASYADGKLARLLLVPALLNRLDTSGLDVLHLHGDDWFYVRRRLPTVRTFHGSALEEARTATRTRRRVAQTVTFGLEVLGSRLATSSYTLGSGQGAAYAPRGVLPNAVDIPLTASLERSEPPCVLFVGTWTGRKRGRLLYEAFQRDVLPRVPAAELHMVSEECPSGPGVHWWRRPSDEELLELYRRAWVFCLPSSYEGFGLPYAEAMAVGTPVVATPNPGAINVLDRGRAGVIVEPDYLGSALVRLLTQASLRRKLGEAGRERVHAFSWKAVIDAHEEAYRETMARWATSGRRRTRQTSASTLLGH